MNKKRNDELLARADKCLRETGALFKKDGCAINASYNGQIAAFGVAIAMSGLLPAIAMYYREGRAEVDRRAILEVIANMLHKEYSSIKDAKSLLAEAIDKHRNNHEFKRDVIDCAIALKQVVRTYKLE